MKDRKEGKKERECYEKKDVTREEIIKVLGIMKNGSTCYRWDFK